MKKLLVVFLAFFLATLPSYAQSMGAVAIIQGGNTAQVASTSGGALQVTIVGGGGGGASQVDNSTFTEGTTSVNVTGCEYVSGGAGNLSTGKAGAPQCTIDRDLYTNLAKVNAITVLTGAGAVGTGAQRVAVGQDTTTIAGSAPGTAGSASANVLTIQGVASMTPLFVEGHAGGAFDAATGAAPPANAILFGALGSGATGGFVTAIPVSDTVVGINITTATTTRLITGVSGRQVRIGSYEMWAGAADNVEWIEGTGATCGTGTQQLGTTTGGGTTSGTQLVFSAAGGVVHGSGFGTVLQTATTGDSVCLVTSAAANLNVSNVLYTIY